MQHDEHEVELKPEQAKRARSWQHEVPTVPKRQRARPPEPAEPLPSARPKGARRPAGRRKYTTDNPRKDVVLRRTLAEMGDGDLRACLEHHSTGDPRAQKLLALMADPANARKSLPLLVQQADFTRRELVEAFQLYKADVMRVKLSNGLPGLADDLIEDSRSRIETCLECNGSGQLYDPTEPEKEPVVCKACRGKGSTRIVGHVESRKMMLDVMGLVKKGAGFGVNINMGSAQVDSFDSLISKAHELGNQSHAPLDVKAEEVPE